MAKAGVGRRATFSRVERSTTAMGIRALYMAPYTTNRIVAG